MSGTALTRDGRFGVKSLEANPGKTSMSRDRPPSDGPRNLSDPDTWSEVVHGYYERIYRTALSQTRRHSLAEEVAQETFIRAFQKQHLFDGRGSLASWLYRIAVNLSRDALRREKVHNHASLSQAGGNASGDPPPPELVHREHLSRVLNEALEQFSEPMRRAFVHTIVMGYSYREAAAIDGVSEGTIASRVARTRNALVQRYRELGI